MQPPALRFEQQTGTRMAGGIQPRKPHTGVPRVLRVRRRRFQGERAEREETRDSHGDGLAEEQGRKETPTPFPVLPTRNQHRGGAWRARWGERLTSAQVMVSRFVSSSPTSGSVPTARSLEPVSESVAPSLSAPPLLALCLPKTNER